GRFDYCRIGPDVSLRFDDVPYMRIFHPERISTKVTLQNTIFRSVFDGRMFLNDPDVFLLRSTNIRLTEAQRRSLTTINALFGSLLMTSDDIGRYNAQQKAVMEQAMLLFREGKVLDYRREGRTIRIDYELRGEKRRMIYVVNRGILKEE
ncbi:MAG: alpha-galactosidase, partial [Firmicutes bacterium]|nr:alpha-galactosidase [Bacillota bacterium]